MRPNSHKTKIDQVCSHNIAMFSVCNNNASHIVCTSDSIKQSSCVKKKKKKLVINNECTKFNC